MLLADCGDPRVDQARNFSSVGRAFRGARSHEDEAHLALVDVLSPIVIRVLVARAPGGAQVLSADGGRPGRPPEGCKGVGGSPLASLGVHGAGRLCGPGRPLPRGLHTVLAPGLNRAGASPGPP